VPCTLYDEKLNRIRNLEGQLKNKGKGVASENDIAKHLSYVSLLAEVTELRNARETYRNTVSRLEDTQD